MDKMTRDSAATAITTDESLLKEFCIYSLVISYLSWTVKKTRDHFGLRWRLSQSFWLGSLGRQFLDQLDDAFEQRQNESNP